MRTFWDKKPKTIKKITQAGKATNDILVITLRLGIQNCTLGVELLQYEHRVFK
jgi:hypothetical protein